MRVLHLPVNTASRASHTVRAQRQIGLDASGLVFAATVVQSSEGLQTVPLGNKRNLGILALGALRFILYLGRYLRRGRPDILHWYYSESATLLGLDLLLIRLLRRPGIIEWTGADIRIPEVEFAENPYYTAVYDKGYEYTAVESLEKSRARQQRYANAGFACTCATGMIQYIQKDIWPQHYIVQQRLILQDYNPTYPDPSTRVPLIVHSPTAPVTKGTAAVLDAIEKLRTHYDFEFKLIQGMPRNQALQLVREADIVLDQFVLGDRGMASIEAMTLGKPVVCYLKPSLVSSYPPENPIVSATQDTLPEVLAGLISDGRRRNELGQRGREYVEEHHDALKIAHQLAGIYQDLKDKWHSS